MTMIKEFLKPIENTLQYEATYLFLQDVYEMTEIAEILGTTRHAVQRRINTAAIKLGFVNESAVQLKQEYIWFLEQRLKELMKK